MEPLRPNFLIAGAAKAATTSVYRWLRHHPQVFLPRQKEPAYFVENHGISNWDEYLALFDEVNNELAIGEASTEYLVSPESPPWIRRKLDDVKIVILLRNPVERALSLYSFMIMKGFEWIPTFEQAIQEEDTRFESDSFRQNNPEFIWDYLYFRSGLYYEQVKRYLDTFDRQDVQIILFEDLVRDPESVYGALCKFLSISSDYRPDFSAANVSRLPRSIPLQHRLRRLRQGCDHLPPLLQYVPRRVIRFLLKCNRKENAKLSIDEKTRSQLQEQYRHNVEQLSTLIERDLSSWVAEPNDDATNKPTESQTSVVANSASWDRAVGG